MGTLRIVGRRGIMREKNKQIWIYVLLILGAIIMIIPFGWMIIVAFTKPDITYQMTSVSYTHLTLPTIRLV